MTHFPFSRDHHALAMENTAAVDCRHADRPETIAFGTR